MVTQRGSTRKAEEQIGTMLVEGGFLSDEELQEALATAREQGMALRDVLTQSAKVSPETFTSFLSLFTRVPLVDLRQVQIQQEAIESISEEAARQFNALPLSIDQDGSLRVALDDPTNPDAINTLAALSGRRIKPRIPMQGDIGALLNQYYKVTPKIGRELEAMLGEGQEQPGPGGGGSAEHSAAQPAPKAPRAARDLLPADELANAPIVRALDMIITQAVKDRASDIHVEPREEAVVVRYRIDGILHEAARLPLGAKNALVSRIKVLSGMDIAERRRPQDGSFTTEVEGRDVDFRVASIETATGEMVVMRVLDKANSVQGLDRLGIQPEALRRYENLLQSPFGMILVSGPTGSGKTTTLYASLAHQDHSTRNIMSIEDPVEYHFQGVNQIQVNPSAGITFASGLRSILRLDPDVILVGEIRDRETAAVAVQAALTGHLVLSSIHANDAASAVIRLIDLGVEPFLVSAALIGSIGQRLVRRVCPYCKTLVTVTPTERAAYQQEMEESRDSFYVGRGCNVCSRTGYQGRIGVYEIMGMSDQLRHQIVSGATADEIRSAAISSGMMTMRRDGMLKAQDGITTVEEVIRNVMTLV